VILALLLVAPAGCRREAPPPPPFEGARPFELACIKEHRPPTRAELEPLVRALIEVAGGEAALRKTNWRKVEDLYLQRSGDPDSNHVMVTTSLRAADLALRTELEYHSGQIEQRVLWKGQEYLAARGQPLAVAMGGNKQYVEWDFEIARLPVWLAEAANLAPLPSRVVDGRTQIGVHVEVDGWNPPFDCWIDPAGPMVVTVEAVLPITGDLSIRTSAKQRVRFSDFRRVDGLLFPFRRDLELDGKRFALGEVREITTGVTLADGDLLPGGKVPEPPEPPKSPEPSKPPK
jgi:hypothetical protein